MEERTYSLYRHTAPNGKSYFGITSQKPEARWGRNGSGYRAQKRMWRAINKYGWNNFTHEVILEDLTEQQARACEIFFIDLFRTTDPKYGLNTSPGGDVKSEETRRKISETKRERFLSGEIIPWTKPVMQIDADGIVVVYASAREAEKKTHASFQHIQHVCRGLRKTAGGLRWEFVNEDRN